MADSPPIRQVDPRRAAQVLFPYILLGVLLTIVWFARDAMAPYLLAFLLIYMLLPVVRWVERWLPSHGRLANLSRPIAAIGTAIATIVLILVLLGILLDPIIDQTSELLTSFSEYWSTLQADHENFRDAYDAIVPERLQAWIDGNVARVGQALLNGAAGMVSWLLNTTGSLIDTGMALVAIPLFVIYYLIDEKQTARTLRIQLPKAWSDDLVAMVAITDRVFGSYTRGVVLEATIVGVITGFGYWLIGVELALPLGVIAFCGEIVPIIGPWIAFMISFPVVLATQPELAIPAILVFLVIQAVEGWVLAPRIQGGSVEFTSSGTLLILAIGGALAGGLGVVFALPVAALALYVNERLAGASPHVARMSLRIFAEASHRQTDAPNGGAGQDPSGTAMKP